MRIFQALARSRIGASLLVPMSDALALMPDLSRRSFLQSISSGLAWSAWQACSRTVNLAASTTPLNSVPGPHFAANTTRAVSPGGPSHMDLSTRSPRSRNTAGSVRMPLIGTERTTGGLYPSPFVSRYGKSGIEVVSCCPGSPRSSTISASSSRYTFNPTHTREVSSTG